MERLYRKGIAQAFWLYVAGLSHRTVCDHFDRSDHILSGGRDLRHKAKTLGRSLFGIGAPSDHVIVADGANLLYGDEGVKRFIVLRPVHVDAERLSVAREGMAVGAGGQVLH